MDDDAEETGSLRYVTNNARLRFVIADAWAHSLEHAQDLPGEVETEGLYNIWNYIAGNALADEVVH